MFDTSTTEPKHKRNTVGLALVALLAALGLYTTVTGIGLGVGTLARMGPGFFPAMLGVGLIGLAVTLFFEERQAPQTMLAMPWRAFVFISAGLCFWAGTVRTLGLAPATFGLIVIASFAEKPFRPIVTLVLALVLSIGGVVLFIYGFRLPIRAFRW